jgi:hypothetical protein
LKQQPRSATCRVRCRCCCWGYNQLYSCWCHGRTVC